MAHRSGGGSHSGGHHSGGHHSSGSHGGSGGGLRYSNKPFHNARRYRYYDRNGRERYLYCNGVPRKMSILELIIKVVLYLPFVFGSFPIIMMVLSALEPPSPLEPVYEKTDVHIMDTIGVIDNEESLEVVLQEFEDKTGISPYVMTVYDSEWQEEYGELWEYAYRIYVNEFTDEQHFLLVYSEPENAAELDFVDWSWEEIQGDETDPILTETNMERFNKDLNDNFLRDNVSVGEAYETALKNSLSYLMERSNGSKESVKILIIFFSIWNLIIIGAIVNVISSYKKTNRDYQEVPMEGIVNNPVPGTMGYGYDDDARYRGSTAYEAGKK